MENWLTFHTFDIINNETIYNMLEQLQILIEDFMYKNKLNTNKVRIIIKEGHGSPFGIAINKVDEIRHKGILPKRREDLFILLDNIEANYNRDSLDNVKLLKRAPNKKNNGDSNNN